MEIRRDTCWVLSNLICITPSFLEAIIVSPLLEEIIEIYARDVKEVIQEANWILNNILQSISTSNVSHMLKSGIVKAIVLKIGKDNT